jgi:putative peptidoglycan lipid II flippase
LLRSSAIVGVGTMLSRLTGMIRTLSAAFVLGGTVLADGYNLANTTPNMVYDLLLGGVLAATLVPVFVVHRETDNDAGTDAVVSVLVTGMVVLTAVALVAAPWIFRMYTWSAPGSDRVELTRVGVPLLRWFLPQILFYGLTAVGNALLNSRRRYAAAAFAPVLNNVMVICMFGSFWMLKARHQVPSVGVVAGDPALLALLGGGTTAGIAAMALVLWPAIRRAGIHLRWNFDLHNRAVRKVFGLSGWTLAYAFVNQVALAVVLALANRRPGDPTAYTYAFIFFQLPYGLFAVSLMTTIEPELSSHVARADAEGFRRQFSLGMRMLLLVMVPASIGSAVLAHPIVNALMGHGNYRKAAPVTGDLLLLFAIGMVGYTMYLYSLRMFYALRDTRTPFLLNVVENAVNIVLAVVFVFVFKWHAQGLALAYAIAYSIGAVLALSAARRRMVRFDGRRTVAAASRIIAAATAMGLAVAAVVRVIGPKDGFASLIPTVVGAVVGVAVYGSLATALDVEELRLVLGRVRRRTARI